MSKTIVKLSVEDIVDILLGVQYRQALLRIMIIFYRE